MGNKPAEDQLQDWWKAAILEDDGSLNFSRLTDFILRHFIKDLDAYYRVTGGQISDLICAKLADYLFRNRRKKILLIAHSMGSIIAWDVLTKWVPEVKIHTLVTIGSPLGNPVVRSRILSELQHAESDACLLKTPENIYKHWYNLADYKDMVAINYDLQNEFLPNSRSVQPQDMLVWNNYEYEGERNPHKSYGYLRSPELTGILKHFLRKGFALFRFLPKDYFSAKYNKSQI